MPKGIYLRKQKSLGERFWVKVRVMESGCWEWQRAKDTRDGFPTYGRFDVQGHLENAHRIAYELVKGTIPEGFQIDHLCRNTLCVNPDHLEAVTPRINQLRGNSFVSQNARKTHCTKGHPFDLVNTYFYNNKRHCRICRWERQNKRRTLDRRVVIESRNIL